MNKRKGLAWLDGRRTHRIYAGNSREIYTDGTLVVKFNDDFLQSTREKRLWRNKIEPADKVYFLAPIGWGDGYILQPFVKFRKGRPSKQIMKKINALGLKYKLEFAAKDQNDAIHANWSILEDGSPKIYDWGI